MHPFEFAARLRHPNPIHPYRWVARYRDGSELRQFDGVFLRRSSEIDRQRLQAVIIEGHRSGPIHFPTASPDEVIIRARTMFIDRQDGQPWEKRVKILVGFRYGNREDVIEIHDTGQIRSYAGPPITETAAAVQLS